MKALVYRKSILRYALQKVLGVVRPKRRPLWLSPLSLREIPDPKLPTPRWARVAPSLAGICGSDLATITAKGSPYLAPVTSMPFVLGHEIVGVVTETGRDVERVRMGDRVVLHPALGCMVRGIDPPCDACRVGRDALCRNVNKGLISAGIQTGYCRDTGGAFSESFVAHESQLYRVPDSIPDRAAVLIEPFACALHGALRVSPCDGETVLIIGCGSIGLLTIAALRAVGCRARLAVAARYDHQRRFARSLGADVFLDAGGSTARQYAIWAETLGAEVLKADLGKPMVIGGADVTFDCVGTSRSIDDGVRFTKSGGDFVLVGMPGMPFGVDWTAIWFKELTVHAAYAYGRERVEGQEVDTFDLAIENMKTLGPKLADLVGEPFPLADYRAAVATAMNSGRTGSVKIVFQLSGNVYRVSTDLASLVRNVGDFAVPVCI